MHPTIHDRKGYPKGPGKGMIQVLYKRFKIDQCLKENLQRLTIEILAAFLEGGGGEAHKESSSRKHNQKAPEDTSFIREKTYTLPITLARGLRIRARTKKRKKRRTEKPGGVPTHSRRSFPFQGTLGPQANCRSGPKKKSRHHEVDVSSGTQLFSWSTWEEGLKEREIRNVTFDFSPEHGDDEDANRHAVVEKRKTYLCP